MYSCLFKSAEKVEWTNMYTGIFVFMLLWLLHEMMQSKINSYIWLKWALFSIFHLIERRPPIQNASSHVLFISFERLRFLRWVPRNEPQKSKISPPTHLTSDEQTRFYSGAVTQKICENWKCRVKLSFHPAIVSIKLDEMIFPSSNFCYKRRKFRILLSVYQWIWSGK